MILVTGATGHLGRFVIDSLLQRVPAKEIIAAVRNVEKAADLQKLGVQVRKADYEQPATWEAVLKGADQVLLISSNELGKRASQHRTVIDAAKKLGTVKLFAYTSVLHANKSPLGLAAEHLETEAMLKSSGLPSVILRNGWYIENYLSGIPSAFKNGAVVGCAKNGQISGATRQDYAEAAAVILTSKDQAGKVYELAGDTAFTLQQFAAELSHQSKKDIEYQDLPRADYKATLLKVGLPEPVAELLSDSDDGVSKGALYDNTHSLSHLIGRPTTSLATAVALALNIR